MSRQSSKNTASLGPFDDAFFIRYRYAYLWLYTSDVFVYKYHNYV